MTIILLSFATDVVSSNYKLTGWFNARIALMLFYMSQGFSSVTVRFDKNEPYPVELRSIWLLSLFEFRLLGGVLVILSLPWKTVFLVWWVKMNFLEHLGYLFERFFCAFSKLRFSLTKPSCFDPLASCLARLLFSQVERYISGTSPRYFSQTEHFKNIPS